MTRRSCMNAAVVISFFAGGLMAAGATIFLAPALKGLKARVRSGTERREPLSREEIIEEGLQCAVPEGIDMCFPENAETLFLDGPSE